MRRYKVTISMVILAVMSFIYGQDIYMWILGGYLKNDHWGLASGLFKAFQPIFGLVLTGGFLWLAYKFFERGKEAELALSGDNQRCPRCGNFMIPRSRWRGIHWFCPRCRKRIKI